jgi:16S rRNA A1518/A1519 N6-dimethyltransferase RsmA/KsgA/DIM1 with predicted DNA glycosylase/AP lyase activity
MFQKKLVSAFCEKREGIRILSVLAQAFMMWNIYLPLTKTFYPPKVKSGSAHA